MARKNNNYTPLLMPMTSETFDWLLKSRFSQLMRFEKLMNGFSDTNKNKQASM